jgi:hypothetical protein
MNLQSNLINTILVVISIGGVVAVNLVIIGLIAIAVIHDGDTATSVAATFEQIIIDAITAVGTLVGSLIGGTAVHRAMIAAQNSKEPTP